MLLKALINVCIVSCYWGLCVGSNADIPQNQFLSSINWEHWNYIDARNLRFIIVENFVDNFHMVNKLHNVTASVIPSTNMADDPLNHFVDAKYLNEAITKELLKDAPAKSFGNTTATVSSLLKEVMIALNPRLDEATQKRLEVLVNLEKERRNRELQTLSEAIRKIIDDSLTNESTVKQVHYIPNGEEWHVIVEKIRSSNLAIEIKKVVSYPVVKEHVHLALNDFGGDIKKMTDQILLTLTPFLVEGLEKKDKAIVGKYTDEVAKREVVRKLVPFYKSLIEQAVSEAKTADSFLSDMYRNRDDLLIKFFGRDTLDEFIRLLRQGLSVFFTYRSKRTNHYGTNSDCRALVENENNSIWTYLKAGYDKIYDWDTIRERLGQLLSALINDNKYTRRVHDDIVILHKLMKNVQHDMLYITVQECKLHLEQHEKFREEKRMDRMVESINKLLEYKHTEIQHSDIQLLKTQFDNHRVWQMMTKEQYEPNFPDKVKTFKVDMESTAITEYGFSPGMFVYSQTYFDILGKISPASREQNKHARSEL